MDEFWLEMDWENTMKTLANVEKSMLFKRIGGDCPKKAGFLLLF